MSQLTSKQITSLETIISKLDGLHDEFTNLSKKSPDGTVNKFKAGIVNQVLAIANAILGERRLPIAGFSQLDLDSLPTNSDATLVLSQYIGAIEVYRCEHIYQNYSSWYYLCSEQGVEVKTAPPKKLTK